MTKKSCLQIVDSTLCFHAESRAEHFEPHFSLVRRLKGGQRPQKLKKARSILCLQIAFSTGWPGNRNIHNAVNVVTYIAHFHAPSRAEHFEPHFSPVRNMTKKSCLQIGDLTPCFHAPSRAEHFEPPFRPVRRLKGGQRP
jgi:hypothetical protein